MAFALTAMRLATLSKTLRGHFCPGYFAQCLMKNRHKSLPILILWQSPESSTFSRIYTILFIILLS